MSERQTHNEKNEGLHEQAEIDAAAAEQLNKLKNNPEASAEDPNKRAEAARKTIEKHNQAPEPTPAAETAPKAPANPLLNVKLNYAQTLASMQRQLKPLSRSFSKVIHAPIVEKTSETLERTIARPSITAGATWMALIVGSLFYFIARHYGYALAGSEVTLSFFVGGALGILLEGLWRATRRRH